MGFNSFVTGPIITALFIAAWEIVGNAHSPTPKNVPYNPTTAGTDTDSAGRYAQLVTATSVGFSSKADPEC